MESSRDYEVFHTPVMVESVLDNLVTDPSGLYVDGTLGGGGHAEAILEYLDEHGQLLGMDRDEEAVVWSKRRLARYGDRIRFFHETFGNMGIAFSSYRIDGCLLDLGVSSHQLDAVERGFSYQSDGPLDCRMDRTMKTDVKTIVNAYSADALADMIYMYGEERASRRIGRAIVEARKEARIETTADLARIVRRVTPQRWQNKTLSRVFQGLRIFINQEMEQLRSALLDAYDLLKPGGRLVVISYHSLEDRMVKRFFRGETPSFRADEETFPLQDVNLGVLTKRAIRPSDEEIGRNPRSRSARLRAAEKLTSGRIQER